MLAKLKLVMAEAALYPPVPPENPTYAVGEPRVVARFTPLSMATYRLPVLGWT